MLPNEPLKDELLEERSILIVDAEGPRHATFRGGAEVHMFFLGERRGPVVNAQGPDKMADCRLVAPSMGGSHQVQLPDKRRQGGWHWHYVCPLHSSLHCTFVFGYWSLEVSRRGINSFRVTRRGFNRKIDRMTWKGWSNSGVLYHLDEDCSQDLAF